MQSLQDYFLIATPKMPDPRFQEQVVYLCAHSEEGAMGVVINRPIPELTFKDILKSAELDIPDGDLPHVYAGGPVEMDHAFFLYSSEYEVQNYLKVSGSVHLSREPRILDDISKGKGPLHYLFLLGYAGWAPGQLENELSSDGWLSLPSELDVLFYAPPEAKWKLAAKKFGIDISVFADVAGTA